MASYNAVIIALEKAVEWEKTLDLLEVMEKLQVASDANSLAAAIRACKNAGQWQQAVALHHEVKAKGLHDTLTYSALMGAYALNAMWMEAVFLLEDLRKQKAAAAAQNVQNFKPW